MPSERVVRAMLGVSVATIAAVTVGAGYGSLGRPGVALGLACAWLLARPLREADVASRVEGALDRLECVAVVSARSVFVAGLCALLTREAWVHLLGAAGVVFAFGLLALALVRDRARMRFLERVYANDHPSLRVERDADVRGWELLPPVVSGVITDAVIAHATAASATYRTSDGPRPLARVASSLPRMMARLERRTRLAGALACGLACAASLVVVVPPSARATAAPRAFSCVIAPACRDAVPYFEDRLESLPGVTRATLLTHARDPNVAEGHGVILLAADPKADTTRANALALARSIPCREPLELTVEEARDRRFDVRAELVLEPGADRAATLRDAEARVRALFQPASRTVESEPVRLGVEEKTFGYRVRHALRHVTGVQAVRLTIDGRDADVPLAPRDFPTLGSLALSVAK